VKKKKNIIFKFSMSNFTQVARVCVLSRTKIFFFFSFLTISLLKKNTTFNTLLHHDEVISVQKMLFSAAVL
jgi:hypothetical protein